MQISSLNEIIQGELLNSPVISFIYSAKTNVAKINEGDLFFAQNKDEIEEAVRNGAFAIVVQEDMKIIDNEIAWIKVKDIKNAIIRYIRFKLSHYELSAYYCDYTRFQLLKHLPITSKNIFYFSNNLEEILTKCDEIKSNYTLFCSCIDTLKSVYPAFKEFEKRKYKVDNLIEHSLSETTFSYNNEYFSKLKLPSLYINEFLDSAIFFNFQIDIQKLKKIDIFKPIFIDRFFNICDYGRSSRFFIVQKKLELVKEELAYLNKNYSYAKRVVISRNDFPFKEENFIIVDELKDFFNKIKNLEFNALYIIGYSKKEIEELFLNKYQCSLFD